MIPTQNRRILTFTAVHPCESVSTTTLIDSLIKIAGEILSFKSKHFSTNKRSLKETLRHVLSLSIIFQEIRVGSTPAGRSFPRSAILSLSELHVVFQKLKYLLQDCTREGAKLYMLINSDKISAHLRVLTRSISTCLDTFPVGSIDLPEEVNELIYLLLRQTRKYEARPDRDDKRALDSVYWFFNLFENRIKPNRDEVIRVLDHIGVRKWSDCVKEIAFIQEEITMEKKDKNEIELLSSLAGFICYCRCVVLQGIDEEEDEDNKQDNDDLIIRGLNVDDLRCPISLEIMNDPVVLETGHTYDRSSIAKWFSAGNITCPKTGKNLVSTVLVDNVSIKQLIQSYFNQEIDHKSKKKKKTSVPESLAAEEAGKLIAGFLAGELIHGGAQEMVKALVEIRILTKTNSSNRSRLVDAGVVESLMKLLRSGDPTIQENAMAAVLNLSKDISGKVRIGGGGGGLETIVEVLNEGARRESRQHAAAAIFYLSSLGDYSRSIGEISDSIPGLLRIVKGCDYGDSAKRNALIAIRSLLIQESDNHWRVLAAGSVSVLLDLVRSGEIGDGVKADSIAVLAKIAEHPDGMISVLRRGGLKLAVKVLGSSEVSPGTKQHCVVLLLNLCVNGGSDVVGALAKDPSVIGSLYTALSNGECGGGRKASALIKMIHEFQERKTEPGLERERFTRW
ncbi:U-box domain-containing protein 19 [Hirschfeldia incana]|nr:U-box domain-containing protein 19 [Hirschfeldia incana]